MRTRRYGDDLNNSTLNWDSLPGTTRTFLMTRVYTECIFQKVNLGSIAAGLSRAGMVNYVTIFNNNQWWPWEMLLFDCCLTILTSLTKKLQKIIFNWIRKTEKTLKSVNNPVQPPTRTKKSKLKTRKNVSLNNLLRGANCLVVCVSRNCKVIKMLTQG